MIPVALATAVASHVIDRLTSPQQQPGYDQIQKTASQDAAPPQPKTGHGHHGLHPTAQSLLLGAQEANA